MGSGVDGSHPKFSQAWFGCSSTGQQWSGRKPQSGLPKSRQKKIQASSSLLPTGMADACLALTLLSSLVMLGALINHARLLLMLFLIRFHLCKLILHIRTGDPTVTCLSSMLHGCSPPHLKPESIRTRRSFKAQDFHFTAELQRTGCPWWHNQLLAWESSLTVPLTGSFPDRRLWNGV